MIILKIITLALGVAFSLFGYFIFFKKKYSLINGFEEDFKCGRKNESYARRVGLIELTAGIILLVISVIFLVFA